MIRRPLSGGTGALDKRGAAATGCPGRTFVSNDAGYQRNRSYFAAAEESHAPDGEQAAFIRRNGSINTTLQILTNGIYTLTFQYCPRNDNNTWYDNHILRTTLNGDVVDTLTVTNHFYSERTVELGELALGVIPSHLMVTAHWPVIPVH